MDSLEEMSEDVSVKPHPVLEQVLGSLKTLHDDPRDREMLREVARLYRERSPAWPPEVPVPWLEVLSRTRESYRGLPPADLMMMGTLFLTLGLWRLTKGAYLYDPDLFRELVSTPLGRVPVELLGRLPEPAPLLLFPEGLPGFPSARGAHVYLDHDPNPPAHLEARWLLWMESGEATGIVLDLVGESLEEAVARTLERTERDVQGVFVRSAHPQVESVYGEMIRALLNVTLYLCQESPDLGGIAPRRPAEVRVRKGRVQVFPPDQPLLIPTGWRWGKAIRIAREAGERRPEGGPTGRAVAPHVRRAHWHLYWTGKGARKDPSQAVPQIKWIPATLVGRAWLQEAGLSEEELPAVVRRVRGGS